MSTNNNPAQPVDILLVEDNPMDAALARRMLHTIAGEIPLNTHWVDSVAKAVSEIQNRRYDLLLLDYQLPGATGLDVLRSVNELPPTDQPAVIMLTASGSERIAVDAMRAGARDYLRKDEMDVAPLTRAILSALSQKRLQDEITRRQNETEHELKMARQLQEALMTRRFPDFPRGAKPGTSALKFHARYLSAADLGGDFYEVFTVSDTEAGALICDVTGHGVPAALITAMLRALAEQLQPLSNDPGRFLAAMNHALLTLLKENQDTPLFATAFYCIADIHRGHLRYANAGHPAQFLLRPNPAKPELITLANATGHSCPALGLCEGTTYETTTIPLAPRDLVLLFTDGLFEINNTNDDELGLPRLAQNIRDAATLPPPRLLDTLIEKGRAWSATGTYADDVCLLALEIQNTGAPTP